MKKLLAILLAGIMILSLAACGGEKNGEALCINDDFSLKVRMENGTEEDLASSEVSIRKR